jgi:very-short-patch-repair endonuclease
MRGPNLSKVSMQRRLRRQQTDAERKLWFALRDRRLEGFKFVRQEEVAGYVADFICRERKLIIEADGGQHKESISDSRRDKKLLAEGYRVLRFWNNDILRNRDGVVETILAALRTEIAAPHPACATLRPPSPRKDGERDHQLDIKPRPARASPLWLPAVSTAATPRQLRRRPRRS